MFRIIAGLLALCDIIVALLFRYRIPLKPPFAKHRYLISMTELVLGILSLSAVVTPPFISFLICMVITALSLLNVFIAQFIG